MVVMGQRLKMAVPEELEGVSRRRMGWTLTMLI